MNKFAEWLKDMLDGTGLFSRAEWAGFLDAPGYIIKNWTEGISAPPPEKLRSLLRVLLESDGVEGVREGFAAIELLPLSEISRLPRETWRGTHTLAEYLSLPLVDGLRRSMAGLTLEQRDQILLQAAEAARKLKE